MTSTPMAMGEIFTNPQEWMTCTSERIIDFARCRVSAVGGITPARKIAALCGSFGVRTAWQEGGDNDPVNFAAACHPDLSSPAFGIQEENRWPELVHELLPGTPKLPDGYACVNEAPGLGYRHRRRDGAEVPDGAAAGPRGRVHRAVHRRVARAPLRFEILSLCGDYSS